MPQFKTGYVGVTDYDTTSKLTSVILSAICQGLQILMIFLSYNHFYHKSNMLSCALNSAGSLVLAISDYYEVSLDVFWMAFSLFRYSRLISLLPFLLEVLVALHSIMTHRRYK